MITPAVATVAAALALPEVWGFSAVRTGPQQHDASVDARTDLVPNWRLAAVSESWLMLSRDCRPARASVALTSRGLSGAEVSIFGRATGCLTSARVLIRARATFTAPTLLVPGAVTGFAGHSARVLVARGRVTSAALAVRTTTARPLVYGSVSGRGKAHVYTARTCKG